MQKGLPGAVGQASEFRGQLLRYVAPGNYAFAAALRAAGDSRVTTFAFADRSLLLRPAHGAFECGGSVAGYVAVEGTNSVAGTPGT